MTTQWEWNFNNNKLSTLSWEESIASGQEPKGLELMNIEAFAFCNYSFLFSWLNPHSLLLVRVKLWSSKDSCKKRFPLHYLSSILNFIFFFIFFFRNPTFHHFCLITWFYNLFPWSFLLYCALTQGCFPSLSPVFFFPFSDSSWFHSH